MEITVHAVGENVAAVQDLINVSRQCSINGLRAQRTYSIVGGVKETLKKANDVTGKVLANGMDKVQHSTPDNLSDAAEKVNKKTGEVLAEGMEKVEEAAPIVNKPSEPVARVKKNAQGYKDLQDKGSKAEAEQNRPEDGL